MQKIQDGIYYRRHQLNDLAQNNSNSRNDCFAIVFLHVSDILTSSEVVEFLRGLWKMYLNLKKGIV